jgi:ectoine hydroxylase-related dioxygenase (phytanoyl-CoA dioxygenase family)
MDKDWSTEHKPTGTLFETPSDKGGWDEFRLTDEQLEFFNENGYLKGVRILSEEQVEVLRHELEGLTDPSKAPRELFYEYNSNESNDPAKILFHALGAWRVRPGFHDILWNPAFVVPASQLLGGAVRFWHDQLFCKPAHHGAEVIWHQDYSYWMRTIPIAHLTCWIGLDDSTKENGCVHYVPRSHRWNLLPREDFTTDMNKVREHLTEEQNEQFKPVAIELKKGEASFHHPMMVHGSFANISHRPRRAAVINVIRDGVMSDSNEPLLEGVPVIPKGKKLDGQFFPLLYDPQADD